MNKLIVITGGTKGIGKALIERFLAEGFDVATCARNQQELAVLKEKMEADYPASKVFIAQADLSSKNQVQQFAGFVADMKRPVEILVNNAGIFIPGITYQEEEGALETMINTNLYSAYHLTRALVDGMIARKHGDIFNICSIASLQAYPNGGSYAISKFALLGFSKVLREELSEHGIRVAAVLPGATLTASWEGVDIPPERLMKAEDVAEAIWSATRLSRQSVIEEIIIRPQLGDL